MAKSKDLFSVILLQQM